MQLAKVSLCVGVRVAKEEMPHMSCRHAEVTLRDAISLDRDKIIILRCRGT